MTYEDFFDNLNPLINEFRFNKEINRLNRFINDKIWDEDTEEYQENARVELEEIENEIANSSGGQNLKELKLTRSDLKRIVNRPIPKDKVEAEALKHELCERYEVLS